jgi:UDP-glucose 4-epimerase
MRIFITGGTGFIGSHTLRELKKRRHRLLILSRVGRRRERDVDFIRGDLSDIPKWKNRLKKFKPEAAVHLAWEGIPDFSYPLCVKNLENGIALFSALAEIGCKKIVAIGTGWEWGKRTGRIPDNINVEPVSAIVAAKQSLRLMGEALAREKGMDFLWLRPFVPYGPGQRLGSLIPHIIRSVRAGIPLRLKNPLIQGDFVYVGDVARAVALAVLRGKGCAAYNVGSGRLIAVREVATMVCEEMKAGKNYIQDFLRSAKGRLIPAPYADIRKIRRELGWRPTTDIRTGIRKTVKWSTSIR